MKNLGNLLKQAQEMQEKMAAMQEELASMEIAGQAGAGLVSVTLNGKGEMTGVKLDPSMVDPSDPTMLEDLIVAAYADARSKVEETMSERMQELTGGMPLPPGFKMPF